MNSNGSFSVNLSVLNGKSLEKWCIQIQVSMVLLKLMNTPCMHKPLGRMMDEVTRTRREGGNG
jgi:hypothetical protein